MMQINEGTSASHWVAESFIIISFGQGERNTQQLVGNELRFAPVW